MQKLQKSDENEMVYQFLRAERDSPRHAEEFQLAFESLRELGMDISYIEQILSNGNITSEQENEIRRRILGVKRGFKKNRGLFENFPENAEWTYAVFGPEDLPKIFYLNFPDWNERTNNTGRPTDFATVLLQDKAENMREFRQIAKNIKNAPPMIFVTDENESRFTILEGHHRMTAYALAPETFENIRVLLGICAGAELKKWPFGNFGRK